MPLDLEIFLKSFFSFHTNISDLSSIQNHITPDTIFKIATNSRFRRTKLSSESSGDIFAKISNAIKQKKAIEFSIPFGAYKNWLVPSFPYPDWAEIFNIKHMISYALPIALNYSPGVVINYSYTSKVLEKVSNLPTKNQEEYVTTFKKFLKYFQKIVPSNLRLELVDIRKYYKPDELEFELNQNFNENVKNWKRKYPEEIRNKKISSAKNNLVITGIEDLRELDKKKLENRYIESAMWCDALDGLKLRREFNKYGSRIQLVYIRGPSHSLHIGSCRASNIQFVMGSGVIENRDNYYIESIVSGKMLKKLLSENKVKMVQVKDYIPIRVQSLENLFVKI